VGALDDIIAGVREDLALRQATTSLERLKERVKIVDPALDPMPSPTRKTARMIENV